MLVHVSVFVGHDTNYLLTKDDKEISVVIACQDILLPCKLQWYPFTNTHTVKACVTEIWTVIEEIVLFFQ